MPNGLCCGNGSWGRQPPKLGGVQVAGHSSLAWSPDGQHVAASAGDPREPGGAIGLLGEGPRLERGGRQ